MNKLSPRLSLISLCLMSAYSFSSHAEESHQTTVLDEITVTGEKFERSQSSTGSSTTVVTGDQFKREANLLSATQLLKRDVNILDTGLGNDLPTVRGVDGSGPAGGAGPRAPAAKAPRAKRPRRVPARGTTSGQAHSAGTRVPAAAKEVSQDWPLLQQLGPPLVLWQAPWLPLQKEQPSLELDPMLELSPTWGRAPLSAAGPSHENPCSNPGWPYLKRQ